MQQKEVLSVSISIPKSSKSVEIPFPFHGVKDEATKTLLGVSPTPQQSIYYTKKDIETLIKYNFKIGKMSNPCVCLTQQASFFHVISISNHNTHSTNG